VNEIERPTPEILVRPLAEIIQDKSDNRDWFLIDVRTEEEFHAAHVAETDLVISHDELEFRLAELSSYKDRTVYCICRSGRRSAYTTELLLANGFPRVFNVVGGVIAWVNAGFELVPSPSK
jgi:rhodanese-related sulfurtransferase